MAIQFEEFLITVAPQHHEFVESLHEDLLGRGCAIVIKPAKNGYVVSYQWEGKTIMNWVFRKAGIIARVYGDHVANYEAMIEKLPADMQKKMTGSRDCKRLLDPTACTSNCVMGMIYSLDGEQYGKCRYDGMNFLLSDENGRYVQELVVAELSARQAQ